jgi:hypothetical protein
VSKFFQLANTATDIVRDHGATAFAVFCYLVKCSNREGRCWPKIGTIAESLGLSDRTTRRTIRCNTQEQYSLSKEKITGEEDPQSEARAAAVIDKILAAGSPIEFDSGERDDRPT